MKLKMTVNHCKQLFAILVCALPLAVNAQMNNMANGTMKTNLDQMGGMTSGNMNPSSKMDDMGSKNMGMNDAKMNNMASDMMNGPNPPKVGDMVPDFTLKTLDDRSVRLRDLTTRSKVVLVVLRGWPGYQCPFCSRQAHDFVRHEEKLKEDGVQVVMVYPGPSDNLKSHAAEFLKDKSWPKDFLLVLDPDYSFSKAYGLRWDAPKETAYPSTFIIDKDNKVVFEHVSTQHGDRVSAETVLKELKTEMM